MNAPDYQQIRVNDVDRVAVVEFIHDRLMFETAVVDRIGDELKRVLADSRYTKVVLDFSNVQYVSSTMLAKLAHLSQDVKLGGRRLKLCALGPILQDAFRIGRLDTLFSVYDDVAAAIKA
jgi:anti-sigma B factor antagonist/stage II sporulation protein AA (anti-sigma F factor antagonist)